MNTNNPNDSGELHLVKAKITEIDSVSQECLDRVCAITRLTLLAMESPQFYQNPCTLRDALQSISGLAEAAKDTINVLAEEVGCNHQGATHRLIWEAHRAACAVQSH